MVCSFGTVFSPPAFLNSPNSKCSMKGKNSSILGSTLRLPIIHWIMEPWVKKALQRYSYAWILSNTKMLIISIWAEKIIFGLLTSHQRVISALVVRDVAGCMGYVLLAEGRCILMIALLHSLISQIFFGVNFSDCRHSSLALSLATGNSLRQNSVQQWLNFPLILLKWRGEAGSLPLCWQHWTKNVQRFIGFIGVLNTLLDKIKMLCYWKTAALPVSSKKSANLTFS